MNRERRTFTAEFKKQMVQLYENGKARNTLIEEYELTPLSLDRWIRQDQQSGSRTDGITFVFWLISRAFATVKDDLP